MSNHWVITADHVAAPGAKPRTNSNAVGVASRGYLDGETLPVEFRAYDGDGELYYEGRMQEEDFDPMDDFCRPNAGCVELRYRRGTGSWKIL